MPRIMMGIGGHDWDEEDQGRCSSCNYDMSF